MDDLPPKASDAPTAEKIVVTFRAGGKLYELECSELDPKSSVGIDVKYNEPERSLFDARPHVVGPSIEFVNLHIFARKYPPKSGVVYTIRELSLPTSEDL